MTFKEAKEKFYHSSLTSEDILSLTLEEQMDLTDLISSLEEPFIYNRETDSYQDSKTYRKWEREKYEVEIACKEARNERVDNPLSNE